MSTAEERVAHVEDQLEKLLESVDLLNKEIGSQLNRLTMLSVQVQNLQEQRSSWASMVQLDAVSKKVDMIESEQREARKAMAEMSRELSNKVQGLSERMSTSMQALTEKMNQNNMALYGTIITVVLGLLWNAMKGY